MSRITFQLLTKEGDESDIDSSELQSELDQVGVGGVTELCQRGQHEKMRDMTRQHTRCCSFNLIGESSAGALHGAERSSR
jgi:hypothetical protein